MEGPGRMASLQGPATSMATCWNGLSAEPRAEPEKRGGQRGPSSALEVHQVLQDLVGAGDDTAVGLEAALGDDQPGELVGQVDVGHLQRAGHEGAAATAAGLADRRLTGVVADPEGAVAGLGQA